MSTERRSGGLLLTRLALIFSGLTILAALAGLLQIWSNNWTAQNVPLLVIFALNDLFTRFYIYFAVLGGLTVVWTLLEPALSADRRWRVIGAVTLLLLAGTVFWLEVLPQIIGWLRGLGFKKWLLHLPAAVTLSMGIVLLVLTLIMVYLWSGSRVFSRLAHLWFARAGRRGVHLCGAALLLLAIILAVSPPLIRRAACSGPNVLLISIDTVRADHFSAYGYGKSTSPELDAFGERGTLFENAVSQAPWTLPSMATIHTALYPHQHGAVLNSHRIRRNALTVAEVFRNAAYRTIGIISHTFVNESFGFAQGFETFDKTWVGDHATITSENLTDTAIDYLQGVGDEKFFMWVHYFDPHANYIHHDAHPFADPDYAGPLDKRIVFQDLSSRVDELTPEDYDYTRAAYDSEIQYTDLHIGRLLNALQEMQIDDRTIVAVVADHGEAFNDHDHLGHGQMVFQELVHVPLMIYDPVRRDLQQLRVDKPVETRALARTLLNAAGLDGTRMPGADLYAVAMGAAPPPVFSEGTYAWGSDKRKLAVVMDNWKLIHHFDDDHLELFDLAADPGETTNIYKSHPPVLDDLMFLLDQRLAEMASQSQSGAQAGLSDEDIQRLKSLGYL
jgi:arylsulfatase A-like enzyme